jgi:hypothetical protein
LIRSFREKKAKGQGKGKNRDANRDTARDTVQEINEMILDGTKVTLWEIE